MVTRDELIATDPPWLECQARGMGYPLLRPYQVGSTIFTASLFCGGNPMMGETHKRISTWAFRLVMLGAVVLTINHIPGAVDAVAVCLGVK